jgi:hypothetical protein
VTDDRYLYVGDHGETLAGGLRVNPGDEVPASQVNVADDESADQAPDQWLIDDGNLVSLTPQALTGDALAARAAELDIERRSSMNAKQLRTAVARAEKQAAAETTTTEQEA